MEHTRIQPSRRQFLAIAAAAAKPAASRLRLPVGLQPYTIRKQLQKDFEGTLRQVAATGYRAIEVSETFYGRTPEETRRAVAENGLRVLAGFTNYPKDDAAWTRSIEYARTLRLRYLITTVPNEWTKSLDGWKRAAERFNQLGEQSHHAGVTLAYHNHNFEFKIFEGKIAYDEFLRLTDPGLVKMEMDCFWTTYAGKDPVTYLQQHPGRFPLLHIKDLKPGWPTGVDWPKGNPFTEVGSGIIDYPRIIKAALASGLKQYYVEQDRTDGDALESARKSCEYLRRLNV